MSAPPSLDKFFDRFNAMIERVFYVVDAAFSAGRETPDATGGETQTRSAAHSAARGWICKKCRHPNAFDDRYCGGCAREKNSPLSL